MKRLGKYLHKSPSRNLIVKILNPKNVPKIGCKVYNSKLEYIGIVRDIIGPVSSPFAVIKPKSKDLELSEGEILYYKPR